MTTALIEKPAPGVTPEQLELVRRTVAKDATADELKLYLYDCQRQGVHPLDKLIHFTKRSGKYTPVTSIDFMRTRAADTGEYAGSDDADFGFQDDGKSLDYATVTVWRLVQGQRCAFTATARWAEYKPESNDFMWRKMPHTMLGKCAEALALRKGFPRQLAGLYAKEELDQADSAPQQTPTRLQVAQLDATTLTEDKTIVGPVVDTESGEQLEPCPPGYHYLTGYDVKDGWHEAVLLNWDAQGGSLKISTKFPKKFDVGDRMAKASNYNIPVKAEVTVNPKRTGEGYVNKLELLREPEAPATTTLPLTADDISF